MNDETQSTLPETQRDITPGDCCDEYPVIHIELEKTRGVVYDFDTRWGRWIEEAGDAASDFAGDL